jgi:hypothetical protein
MVLQFYFFLNHVLRKTERTPEEHYGENPYQTPKSNILYIRSKINYKYKEDVFH